MKPYRVAIIGAGLSGLATAVELCEQQDAPELTVFEASDRIGGVIDTEIVQLGESHGGGRLVLDHGADMFATQPSAAIELCRRLGIDDQLQLPKHAGRGAMIAMGNRLVRIPEGFVLMRPTRLRSMLSTPLLSVAGKLRLAAEALVPRRGGDVKDESVGSFVRRRMGEECLQRIVAPLVAGIYTADVERLSMAATMKPIWEMELAHGSLTAATWHRRRQGLDGTEKNSSGARYEQFRAFPGGMRQFLQRLMDRLPAQTVRFRSPVTTLMIEPDGVRLSPATERFDQVVLAVPGKGAATLLGKLEIDGEVGSDAAALGGAVSAGAEAAGQLARIPTASTAIVVMVVRRNAIKRLPSTFGFVVPPREGRAVLAGSFASEKFDGRAPHDLVIVRAFVGGRLNPEVLRLADDEIVNIVRGDLCALIGMDATSPLSTIAPVVRVVRWNDAMPQYEVGHEAIADSVEAAMTALPRIHLAGNSLRGIGIAPLIAAAGRMAASVRDCQSRQRNDKVPE